jgi:hypothetical protein
VGTHGTFSLTRDSLPLVIGTAAIQYRFTAILGTDWEIDDLYVDPRMLKPGS